MNRWSHVACIFNLATQTQQIYLNGNLDGSHSSVAFQGSSGDTTIGVTYLTPPGSNYFNGYLDQMQFISRAKNASEILRDATLIAYYSFDNGSTADNGPNGINATAIGSPAIVTGRVNQALQMNSSAYVRITYPSFIMLGMSSQSHTFSLWVKPINIYAVSTILFVSKTSWCVSVITMTSNGNVMAYSYNGNPITVSGPVLALNAWTHVAFTYSSSNGGRLYTNGTLFSTSAVFNYIGAGDSVSVTIGYNLGLNGCTPGYGGGFTGALDEFYVYSRELTASEIFALANP
ncbi:unnamed protein product [Rotaria sordida]|uniref:Uncharacterized protein n=1 Tax=Rotaria sordida TaxID=392033 RepID=A0A815D4L3_9BILA|nr:unnamed protein product [Rotaria sordida]CAF4061801.1 unnamed protein product [Rotaria sordida]